MNLLLTALLLGAALVAVLYPVFRRPSTHAPADEAALRDELKRYRAAVRARTVCRFCHQANPDKSRFCMDCGRLLES